MDFPRPQCAWRYLKLLMHCSSSILLPILHSAAIFSPGKECTCPSFSRVKETWFIRPGHLLTLLGGPFMMLAAQFLARWATDTDLHGQPSKHRHKVTVYALHNKLQSTVGSETFLLEPVLTFLAVWAIYIILLEWTTLASLFFPHVIGSLSSPLSFHWFAGFPYLEHYW